MAELKLRFLHLKWHSSQFTWPAQSSFWNTTDWSEFLGNTWWFLLSWTACSFSSFSHLHHERPGKWETQTDGGMHCRSPGWIASPPTHMQVILLSDGKVISASLNLPLNFSGPQFCCADNWKYGLLLKINFIKSWHYFQSLRNHLIILYITWRVNVKMQVSFFWR